MGVPLIRFSCKPLLLCAWNLVSKNNHKVAVHDYFEHQKTNGKSYFDGDADEHEKVDAILAVNTVNTASLFQIKIHPL